MAARDARNKLMGGGGFMFVRLLTGLLIAVLLVPVARACTAFVVFRNGTALAGNNEDFWQTDTKMWIVPRTGSTRGSAGKYGRVYFGFNNFFPQGGMNESGLFFDGFATARNPVKNSLDLPRFSGNIVDNVMANCGSVAEVVAVFEKHNLSFLENAMLMFGDRQGDSVIIEGDKMLRINGDHQVVTNFYQSLTPKEKCPCNRYKTAAAMLDAGNPGSVENCRDILAATCQTGSAPTQYSNVYDLKKGRVYLYHFQDFENVVCINLAEELDKGASEIDLPSLFPEKEKFKRFKEARAKQILQKTEARRDRTFDPARLQDYVGTYSFDTGQAAKVKISMAQKGTGLFGSRAGETESIEIFPEGNDTFFRFGENGLEVYVFRRDADNQVVAVTLSLKELGRTYEGEKDLEDGSSSEPSA